MRSNESVEVHFFIREPCGLLVIPPGSLSKIRVADLAAAIFGIWLFAVARIWRAASTSASIARPTSTCYLLLAKFTYRHALRSLATPEMLHRSGLQDY